MLTRPWAGPQELHTPIPLVDMYDSFMATNGVIDNDIASIVLFCAVVDVAAVVGVTVVRYMPRYMVDGTRRDGLI